MSSVRVCECVCVYVCECVGGLSVVPDLSWICVLLVCTVPLCTPRDESVCRKARQAVMVMMGWDGPMYHLLAGKGSSPACNQGPRGNLEGPK